MFKKNEKQTENVKEKKVRTVKVGTHKKTVIALWAVLIASVSFGVYKNFTAIDQHTTHEKEIIELRLQDTNGIENFVKNFAKSYYTWNNSKEAIEARTQAISGYLTKELQDLNIDTIRTDIPTSSTVTDVIVWSIEQSGTDTFSATYEVDQQIKEGEQTNNVKAKVIINKELSRVNAEAMQKLKEKDILKIFPTQKPHCTTRLVLKTPKTETSNRVVWLPKTVAELLVQYKKDQQELKEFLGSAYNDYNLVIALDNGNPVESRIVRDRFQRLCEENDYEVVVFHSLRHLSTGYKLKMTNGDVKSVQGDTGHAEAEMVTDVYSKIIDEDRRFNAQKMDKEFYSTLNDDTNNPTQDTAVTDSDMALLELIKSLSPEMKEQFLKQALQR